MQTIFQSAYEYLKVGTRQNLMAKNIRFASRDCVVNPRYTGQKSVFRVLTNPTLPFSEKQSH